MGITDTGNYRTIMAWQPIDSAPPDTRVIVFNNGMAQFATYNSHFRAWLGDDEGLEDWAPTHWMPCPRDPA